MPTVSDLIHSSFRLIGAVAAGEILETNELNDAFVSLNQMLASWNTEGASLVGRQRVIISLPTQINGPYPLPQRLVRIESASASSGAGIDSPLELVDSAGWEAITEKAMVSVYTRKLYCDYAYPTSSVWIWPLPRVFPALLELWAYLPINQFVTVNDTIDLAPGYEIALRYNFAVALLPEYPRAAVDQTLPAQAQNYKASIVQLNNQNHRLSQTPSATQAVTTDAAEVAAR